MTLGDFELASFKAVFDILWFDTVLRFTRQPTKLEFRRSAMKLRVDVMFGMFRDIFRGAITGWVFTWFRGVSWRGHCRFVRLTCSALLALSAHEIHTWNWYRRLVKIRRLRELKEGLPLFK